VLEDALRACDVRTARAQSDVAIWQVEQKGR
jgi:hypothetical protein